MKSNVVNKIQSLLNGEYIWSLNKKQMLYYGVLVAFVVIATVISSGFSRDSHNYNRMYEMFGASGLSGLTTEMFVHEAFIVVVSKILYALGLSSVFLFLLHSAISLSIKFYLIDKHSKDKILSLSFFASYFFILHDSTQIRFGMAVAFVYLALHFLADNRKLLFSAIVIFSAIAFHVSVLGFIIMLFFTTRKSLFWLFGMVVVATLLYPVDFNIVFSGMIEYVINYYNIHGTFLNSLYSTLQKPYLGLHFELFNWRVVLVYFCVAVIFRYRSELSKYELLCYNALIFSVFVYIFMKDVVEIQYRISGLFGFSLVFLVPYIHQWLSEYMSKINAYIILLSFFTVYLLKFALYDKMIII